MKPAARVGDLSTGHSCFPPRPCVSASPNVLVNGRQAQIVGSVYAKHCCDDSCHSGTVQTGTSMVLINGKASSGIGDRISCGDVIMTASDNVYYGG